MLIESVELRNVKSYAEPGSKIHFRPGVNLIWGDNGSGKTTILEAIGYALFGAIDYKLAQFLREGVKEGEIVLTFEGKDDRSYQVVRNLKGAGKFEIHDPQTGRKLISKRQDAEEWLTDYLGIEFGGYGKLLFENALGVAQGKMTGSFLENESTRKDIFAPILRVNEYDIAWDNLAGTSSKLRERIGQVKEEIARLQGRLEKLPEQETQLAALAAQIASESVSLVSRKVKLTEQQAAIISFETCKAEVDQADGERKGAQSQLKLLFEQMTSAERTWQEAEDAVQILQACQSGYDLYVQAEARKRELLVQQDAYYEDQQRLLKIEGELGELKARLVTLAEQLKGIADAEKRIGELEPQVQRQAQLEEAVERYKKQAAEHQAALDKAQASLQAVPPLRKQLEGVYAELKRRTEIGFQIGAQQELLADLQVVVAGIEADETKLLAEIDALDEQLKIAREDARAFGEAERNWQRVEKELADALAQLGRVEQELQERAELDQQIQALEVEIQAQNTRVSEAQAEAQQCAQRAGELQDRLIMLQNAETADCPVCKRPLEEHEAHDVEDEFEAEIKALKSREEAALQIAQDVDREIGALRKQETTFKKRRDKLPAEQRAEEIRTEMAGKREQTLAFKSKMDGLMDASQRVNRLETERKGLDERKTVLRQDLQARRKEVEQTQGLVSKLNAELAGLAQPTQAADLENRIATHEKEAQEGQVKACELADAPAHLEAEEAALAQLNDPRAEQTKLKGIVGQRPEVEKEQQRLETVRDECAGRCQIQQRALQAYAGLELALVEANEDIEQNKKAYQDYLANQKTALASKQRWEQLDAVRGQHTAQAALCEMLNAAWQAAQARYDAEQHTRLHQEIEQLDREVTQMETRLGEWRDQHQRLDNEVVQLRQQQIALDVSLRQQSTLEHLASVLKFVREGIRQAGPQVVRQRVKAISYSADRIFQDIINDTSLRLNWDETYEITVSRRSEERTFKQLSGGEQMAAAIAVRLALMIQMSDLRVLFLDEPTANMDDTRRDNLADRITSIEGLKQIFVITHDDAFRRDTHHFIQISKQDGVSIVQVGG